MKCISSAPTDWGDRPFVDYMCEVDRLLHDLFGITSDDLGAVAAAQEAGETPEEHVEWLAEHYGLCPLPSVELGGGVPC